MVGGVGRGALLQQSVPPREAESHQRDMIKGGAGVENPAP